VLQELALFRIDVVLHAECRERRLVEARQDQLLLAGGRRSPADRALADALQLAFILPHLAMSLID
jgi:hypothetical protein